MPLSYCRICGKRIPNFYRKDHEQKRCVVMKARKGLLKPDHPYHKQNHEPKQGPLDQYLTVNEGFNDNIS